MRTFREFVQALSQGLFTPVKPFTTKRHSTETPILSCKERTRRLVRRFRPRVVQDVPEVPTAVAKREPFTWSTVR